MKILQSINNFSLAYENRTLACTPPCSLYSVLLENKLIDDPYYRDNEYEIKKLSDNDYTFTSIFSVNEEMLNKVVTELVFYGLDTLCDVYLNGSLLGKTDNMHRTWRFDVKDKLNIGENSLTLNFHSPTKYIKEAYRKHPMWGEKIGMQGFGHIRKCHCQFGWDWGPTLPDMGIFRQVDLVSYDSLIDNVYITQHHADGKVMLCVNTEIKGDKNVKQVIKITAPNGTVIVSDKSEIIIENPSLWWPNGLGEQPLYTVEVSIIKDGKTCDVNSEKIGLRTLTISNEADSLGREFCFKVNGKKFFAMGANYIPEDTLIATRSHERTARLISDCVKANHNCIRVWGGGFYPDDWFYDECDKNGLVVWQDFMFACTHTYLTTRFKENVTAEFCDNLKRIRNRTCLGLLCGNNEIESYLAGNPNACKNELAKKDYLELFEHILPEICEELAPDIFYIPSSPTSGGGFEKTSADNMGDQHYWGCWHGSIPFEDYRNHFFRFCSEFGFESFPAMETIESFSKPEDRNPFSRIMESHQKCNGGNLKMLSYAADKYLYPTSFESFVYTTQILQADAIRYGVEHFRRHRGKCMGSIYWQLNDCWQTASWSSIDYFGRWKALHYVSKRFYAPVMASAHDSGTNVTLNVTNETLNTFNGTLEYYVKTNCLDTVFADKAKVEIDPLSSSDIIAKDFAEYLGNKRNCFLCFALKDENGVTVSEGTLLFAKPKHFEFNSPNFSYSIKEEKGEYYLEISADCFAKFVQLTFEDEIFPEDNFFDIYDTHPRKIKLRGISEKGNVAAIKESIKIFCVNNLR